MRAVASWVLLLVLLAACKEAASSPPEPSFNVGVRGSVTTCSFEMYSPVSFTASVAPGEEKRDTIAHAAGRFPLGWRAHAGAVTDLSSGLSDSIDVPGGFTFVC